MEMTDYVEEVRDAVSQSIEFVFGEERAIEAIEESWKQTGNRWAAQDAFKRRWRRLARAASEQALAGAVLQIAKQGISIVHSDLNSCPPGRLIRGVALKDLIWAARNQSMHWEEGDPHQRTRTVFEALSVAGEPQWETLETTPLAREVMQLLCWKTVDEFEADMLSLG